MRNKKYRNMIIMTDIIMMHNQNVGSSTAEEEQQLNHSRYFSQSEEIVDFGEKSLLIAAKHEITVQFILISTHAVQSLD